MTTNLYFGFDALTWATTALVLATAALAFLAWRQLRAGAQAAKADHLRRRGEATMRAVDAFVNAYSEEHERLLAAARGKGLTVKALIQKHGNDPEVVSTLQGQLDALEMLACGARLRIYDLNTVHHTARSVIRQLGDRTTTLRGDMRDGRLDTRPAQPSAYEHTRWLLQELEAKSGEGAVQLDGTLTGTE